MARTKAKLGRIEKVVVVFMVSVILATAVAAVFAQNGQSVHVKTTPGGRPLLGEKLNLTMPDATDEAAVKVFVDKLYTIANENHKNTERVSWWVNSETTTMGIPVYGFRYGVKNADEWFQMEYSFVFSNSFLLSVFAEDSTMFAERVYTNKNLPKVYSEKVLNPMVEEMENEMPKYYADWSNLHSKNEREKFTYYAEQDDKLEITDQKISLETIKTASIVYNEEEGFYHIEVELDVTNPITTAKTLPQLKKGTGSDEVAYTSIKETIEIWDNGYYKYFLSIDNWAGKVMGFPMNSTIDFETNYYYDDEKTTFANYKYADEFIKQCNEKNQIEVK